MTLPKLKYVDTAVTFAEVPDEISLCINISNCPIKCKDCHSKYLWENIGKQLNTKILDSLIKQNEGITCICFMGGDINVKEILIFARYIRKNYSNLKIAWYSGQEKISKIIKRELHNFDYIKTGPFIKEFGPLNSKTTNQRLYEVCCISIWKVYHDITYKFWKNDKKDN